MRYLIVQAYWYFDNVTGEYHYRIQGPAEALSDHSKFQVVNIHIFHPLFPQMALSADLLILHLLPDSEVYRIIELRRKAGKPTIFEIADNFLQLGPWVEPDDAHRNPEVRQNFLRFASICEGLQFSTEALAETFAFLNENHRVFENQVNHFEDKLPDFEPLVFGWGGSIGHRDDLARIAPAIKGFCEAHEDVAFSYMGYPPIFEELFGDLPEGRGRCREAGPVEDYYDWLTGLHIGLAPLENTAFNKSRSDVKFIEYCAHRVLPLLSDAAPYRVHGRHEENCLIFKDPDELRQHLELLYKNRKLLIELGHKAFEYARTERDRALHTRERASYYRELLDFPPSVNDLPLLPDCSGLIGYMRQITFHFDGGQFAEALKTCDKVLQMHGNYHLAHAFRAKALVCLGRFEQVLVEYGNYEHSQIYNDLFSECFVVAARSLEKPKWRAMLRHISDPILRIQMDPEMDEEARARAILELHPYHYESLLTLANLMEERRKTGKKHKALLERALFIHPENDALRFRMARF